MRTGGVGDHFDLEVAIRGGSPEEGTQKIHLQVPPSFVSSGTNLWWEAFPILKSPFSKLDIDEVTVSTASQ